MAAAEAAAAATDFHVCWARVVPHLAANKVRIAGTLTACVESPGPGARISESASQSCKHSQSAHFEKTLKADNDCFSTALAQKYATEAQRDAFRGGGESQAQSCALTCNWGGGAGSCCAAHLLCCPLPACTPQLTLRPVASIRGAAPRH